MRSPRDLGHDAACQAKDFNWQVVHALLDGADPALQPELVDCQPLGRNGMRRWSCIHQAALVILTDCKQNCWRGFGVCTVRPLLLESQCNADVVLQQPKFHSPVPGVLVLAASARFVT